MKLNLSFNKWYSLFLEEQNKSFNKCNIERFKLTGDIDKDIDNLLPFMAYYSEFLLLPKLSSNKTYYVNRFLDPNGLYLLGYTYKDDLCDFQLLFKPSALIKYNNKDDFYKNGTSSVKDEDVVISVLMDLVFEMKDYYLKNNLLDKGENKL